MIFFNLKNNVIAREFLESVYVIDLVIYLPLLISVSLRAWPSGLESQTLNHKVVGSNPLVESNTTARHNWQLCLKINARANPSHVRRFGETNERVHRWTSQDNLAKHHE